MTSIKQYSDAELSYFCEIKRELYFPHSIMHLSLKTRIYDAGIDSSHHNIIIIKCRFV